MQISYSYTAPINEVQIINMTTNTTKFFKVTASLLLLISMSACTNTQTSPSMVDYSYVPPSQIMSNTPLPSLEDY